MKQIKYYPIFCTLIVLLWVPLQSDAQTSRNRPQTRASENPSEGSAARRPLVRPQVTTTERSYEAYKSNFCNERNPANGEALLRELDKANEDAFLEMDQIKNQLNSEIAALTIINDTLKAKADYQLSMNKIAVGSPGEAETIQSIRSAFNSASALFAVKILSDKGADNFNIETFKKNFCQQTNEPENCIRSNNHSINFLATAYEKVKDKAALNANIASILKDIPTRLAPQVTIALLKDHTLLNKNLDPKVIDIMIRCLDENNRNNKAECREFFTKAEYRELINNVISEGQKIQSSIAPLAPEIKAAVEKSKLDYERHSAILSKTIADSEQEKNNCEKKYREAQERCSGFMAEYFPDAPSLLASCTTDDNSEMARSLARNIKNNTEKLKKITSGDSSGKFNTVEIFKIYAANKYLCQCTGSNKTQWKNQTTCYNSDTSFTSVLFSLEGDVSNVLKRMKFSSDKSFFLDKCGSSPDLLLEAKNKCDNNAGKDSTYNKICSIIYNENALVEEKTKKEKEWEDLNRDFYVKVDTVRGGHIKVKKKSNWELAGESILPVLPGVVPLWLGNMQLKSQIQMMTDQALAEKQYFHNIDVYNQNPWMYSYPYYQANYFQLFGSPFIGDSLASPAQSNPGYNFSP